MSRQRRSVKNRLIEIRCKSTFLLLYSPIRAEQTVEREECVRVLRAHQGTVQCLRVSPDGSRLASCGDDGAITLWNLNSGEYLRTLRRDRPYERLDISGVKGLTRAQKASLRALGAIEIDPVLDIQDAP